MNDDKRKNGTRTTWPKGQKPPVQKPKGSKHKSTIIKETLGLGGFEALKHYLGTDGAEKAVDALSTLKGKVFVQEYGKLLEYIKPRLNRTTHVTDPDTPLQMQVTSLEKLTFEQLMQLKYGPAKDATELQK